MITAVKTVGESYLVNGSITVPKDPGNRDYKEVLKWLSVGGNKPDPEFTPQEAAARNSKNVQKIMDNTDASSIRAIPELRTILTGRPAQIDAWVNTNVTNIASAKDAIGMLAKAVSLLLKDDFRQ